MPQPLNQRQEKFALAVADGTNPLKAYKDAGYGRSTGNAYILMKNERIIARVEQLKATRSLRIAQVQKRVAMNGMALETLTKQWVMDRLQEATSLAMAVDVDTGEPKSTFNLPAANRALELLGKQLGLFIDRKESGRPGDFAGLTDAELESRLMQTLMDRGLSEEQARILVARQRVRGGILDPSTRVAPPQVTDIEPSSSEVAADEAKRSPGERAKS